MDGSRDLNWIVEQPPLHRLERLQIYSYAYHARLVECLAEDFDALRDILGENLFEEIAKEFVLTHPSRFASANEVGKPFAGFLAKLPKLADKPWAIDLARFEWSMVEAFYAFEAPRRGAEHLASATAQDWSELRVELDPSVQLFCSKWNLSSMLEDRTPPREESPYWGMVYRLEGDSHWQELTQPRYQLLLRLSAGAPIAEATSDLSSSDFNSELFSDWWTSGIIRSLRWPARHP